MRVNFVTSANSTRLVEPALDYVPKLGHEAVLYNSPEDFLNDANGLAASDVIVGIHLLKVTGDLMDRAPSLRAVVSPVTGTDSIDEKAASARTILVANGQIPETYTGMGEAAVLMILASLYDLNTSQRVLRENLPRPKELKARMLMGKTIGLIGFGQIAQVVASRLSTWNTNIVTYVRSPRELPGNVTAMSLDEVLARSDVVVVATPLTPETRGMLSYESLKRMKPDVTFVNIARGGIAPDDDLARLGAERPDMRLALDVFDPEPLRQDSPIRNLPNAILTPHMVGHTVEMQKNMPMALCENLEHILKGEAPEYIRNPEILPDWLKKWGI